MVKCCPLCIVRARLLAQICLLVRRKDSSAATLLTGFWQEGESWLSLVNGLIPCSRRLPGELRDLPSPCGYSQTELAKSAACRTLFLKVKHRAKCVQPGGCRIQSPPAQRRGSNICQSSTNCPGLLSGSVTAPSVTRKL